MQVTDPPPLAMPPIRCAECSRHPDRGEVWRLYFADIGEVVIYCPQCAEREFGSDRSVHTRGMKFGDP
jgi:hypothetical protein